MRSLEESVWIGIEKCPACGGEDNSQLGKLAIEEYHFGGESIPLPPEGVALSRCRNCGLVFKNILPSPEFLAEAFGRQKGKIWTGDYDFADEAELIRGLVDGRDFDLLDIGPSKGGLLKAFSDSGGRRSALDIVEHPGLEEWLRGEFIHGLCESYGFSWSGEPYDVVGMFDIVEHLYEPEQAFSNLRDLVKPGGFVVLETGDVQSHWPQKFGVHRWWYASFFPHHIFWSRGCLEYVANRNGFYLVDIHQKRHKNRGTVPLKRDLVTVAKSMLYRINPDLHIKLARRLGKSGTQPWSPFTKDHFQAVLQRSERQ